MFRKILVAIDGSATANRGLKSAITLAKDQNATLAIVYVLDDLAVVPGVDAGFVPAEYIDGMIESMRGYGRQLLAKAEALAKGQAVASRGILVESLGRGVAQTILLLAGKMRSDLIVLGTHGRRGLRRALLGSDAEAIVRQSRVPVMLVRSPEPRIRVAKSAAQRLPVKTRTAGKAKGRGERPARLALQ